MSNLILFPSTAERDRTFKRALYANHGVNEYWIVDITAKDIIVLLLGERGYEVVYPRRRRDIDFADLARAHAEYRRSILKYSV